MNIEWNYRELSCVLYDREMHVRFGLREDGVVVWQELEYNGETRLWEPVKDNKPKI